MALKAQKFLDQHRKEAAGQMKEEHAKMLAGKEQEWKIMSEHRRIQEESIIQEIKQQREHDRAVAVRVRKKAKEAEVLYTINVTKQIEEEAEKSRKAWEEGHANLIDYRNGLKEEERKRKELVRKENQQYEQYTQQRERERIETKWKSVQSFQAGFLQEEQEFLALRYKEIRETNRQRVLERRRRLQQSCPFLANAAASTTPRARPKPKPPQEGDKKRSHGETKLRRATSDGRRSKYVDPKVLHQQEEDATARHMEDLYKVLCKQVECCFTVPWPTARRMARITEHHQRLQQQPPPAARPPSSQAKGNGRGALHLTTDTEDGFFLTGGGAEMDVGEQGDGGGESQGESEDPGCHPEAGGGMVLDPMSYDDLFSHSRAATTGPWHSNV